MCLAFSCSSEKLDTAQPLSLSMSLEPFVSEHATKANLEGTDFADGDMIKLKVICPYVKSSQVGEYTSGGSNDSYWLMKYRGGSWGALTAADGFDISGSHSPSGSPNIVGQYLSQVTPYVFTASTWSEEKEFVINNNLRLHYSHVFHADQRDEKYYRANDLLWGQSYMQTASWNVYIRFNHVMSALLITLDVPSSISSDAVLMLDGMPDIDKREVVVGNYYADKDKNSNPYGPRNSTSCSKENNGKVIGVAVIDEAAGRVKTYSMTGNPSPAGGDYNSTKWGEVPNTGAYIAHHVSGRIYRMIVPPCELATAPVFYLKDGEKSYRMEFSQKTFEQGYLYPITLSISE